LASTVGIGWTLIVAVFAALVTVVLEAGGTVALEAGGAFGAEGMGSGATVGFGSGATAGTVLETIAPGTGAPTAFSFAFGVGATIGLDSTRTIVVGSTLAGGDG
jgi:hypothetical protein